MSLGDGDCGFVLSERDLINRTQILKANFKGAQSVEGFLRKPRTSTNGQL